MNIVEVRFEVTEEGEEDRGLIEILTHSWRANGQILGSEFPMVFAKNAYRLVFMVPKADSLDTHHDCKYVTSGKSLLNKAGFRGPFITVLGEDPFSAEPCSCSKRSYFILYTTYSSLESSLHCGDCFSPVPRYEISNVDSPSRELFDLFNSWGSDYQSCDSLQMNCNTGEKFGLREISNHDSSLSKRGREICDTITAAEGLPAYYYLHRYRGRSRVSEKKRKCPSCGGDWLLQEQLHETFDFKCDHCRLLSNIALSIP
ncbi:MAG: hypothetical protein EOP04_27585 [Proteobacteria bacterium]|nr:MAG: hypothetical protein EOP04_27585 [Pseudomonadota bacterium]